MIENNCFQHVFHGKYNFPIDKDMYFFLFLPSHPPVSLTDGLLKHHDAFTPLTLIRTFLVTPQSALSVIDASASFSTIPVPFI